MEKRLSKILVEERLRRRLIEKDEKFDGEVNNTFDGEKTEKKFVGEKTEDV
jgi:hypothetical protein